MVDGIHHWPLFVGAGLLLNLTPGADMALVASRSAAQGFKAGAAAALGVGAGCWVHTGAAALGLSALMAGSELAFAALRWVGAAYLVWLGVALLRSRPSARPSAGPAPVTALRRLFAQGFLTNALNPKVALFFLAFVPQFIRADAPHKAAAFVLLGTVFVVNSTLVNLLLAALVARLSRQFGQRPGAQRLGLWLNRGVGALFVALGLRLALGDPAR
ncbi:MAG: lysine transporter LysE [Alphaproteobacteria bacterium PA3]|nr:MAG: lysine transporter LysE [Alphaproteobacteria bacterium PA3]